MNEPRPILSLTDLETFDPRASTGERRRFCCPLCGQDKPRDGAHRCLSVETSSGLWRCFRCEAKGQLREKWQEKPFRRSHRSQESIRRAFALEKTEQSRGVSFGLAQTAPLRRLLPEPSPPPAVTQEPAMQPVDVPLQRALHGLRPLSGTAGETYMRGRGLPLDVCLAAKVEFALSWLGRPAVVFPLYDAYGQLLAAQGRYTDGRDDPKTRTLGPKKEGTFLSANFWEQIKRGAPLVITEAPIDALSLATCGFPALALCGKSGWPSWLPIKCAFKEVTIAFDGDGAGEEGATRLRPVIESLGAKVRRVVPEDNKDWNEMLLNLGKEKMEDWLCLHLL